MRTVRGTACRRHATKSPCCSVSPTSRRTTASATPHCAPLRCASMGLLGFRASGTSPQPVLSFYCLLLVNRRRKTMVWTWQCDVIGTGKRFRYGAVTKRDGGMQRGYDITLFTYSLSNNTLLNHHFRIVGEITFEPIAGVHLKFFVGIYGDIIVSVFCWPQIMIIDDHIHSSIGLRYRTNIGVI